MNAHPRSDDRPVADAVDAPRRVRIVMATTGEYSDRSEWPICAYFSEELAQARVDALSVALLAAASRKPEHPSDAEGSDESDAAWDAYQRAIERWERVSGKPLKTLGFGLTSYNTDATFFLAETVLVDGARASTTDDQTGPGTTTENETKP